MHEYMLQEVYCFIISSFIGPIVTVEYREYYYGSYACMLCKFASGYDVFTTRLSSNFQQITISFK